MNQQETPSAECINDLTVAAVQSLSDQTCRERNVNGAQCTSALAANFAAVQTVRGQKPSCGATGSSPPIQAAAAKLYAYIDSKEFQTFLASLTPEDLKRIDLATNEMLERDRHAMLAALQEWRDEYKTYYARLAPEPTSVSLAQLFAPASIDIRNIYRFPAFVSAASAGAPVKPTLISADSSHTPPPR